MRLNYNIQPLSTALVPALQDKIDQKTKPKGALGQLESLALQIGRIQNSLAPSLNNPCIIVFAGDHGIAQAGVSAYPQTVTAQMVANFMRGRAAINVFARQHGIDLLIVDSGVNADLSGFPGLINASLGQGTANFLEQPAMTEAQCRKALQTGADLVEIQYQKNCNCIGFGEMGIGNTSSAALIQHRLTGLPLDQCVGRGTGLNDHQLDRKLLLLRQALKRHPCLTEPLEVLAAFGGFEIAMMAGAYLKAAELNTLMLVDGLCRPFSRKAAARIG